MKFDKEKLSTMLSERKKLMGSKGPANFKPGKNRIRLLPGWDAANRERWFHDWGKHYVKDAAGNMVETYVCDWATYGHSCKVCAALKAAQRAVSDDATAAVLADAAVSRKILINVLFLDSASPSTPVTVAIGTRLFDQLKDYMDDPEYGMEALLDPDGSFEITVNRSGEGMGTTYTATVGRKPGAKIPQEVIDSIPDLAAFVDSNAGDQAMKAITAINDVAGILPAPATRAPSTTASGLGAIGVSPKAAPIGAMRTRPTPAAVEDVKPGLDAADLALDAEFEELLGPDDAE